MHTGPALDKRSTIGRNDTAASKNGLTSAIIHEMADQTILQSSTVSAMTAAMRTNPVRPCRGPVMSPMPVPVTDETRTPR